MTRDELWQQHLAETNPPPPPPPNPNAPALVQMFQGGFSQPPTRDELATSAGLVTDPREAVAAGFGNALGLVGSDNPRYQAQNRDYPDYVTNGQGLGYTLDAAATAAGIPGAVRAVSAVPAIATRTAEEGLKYGGPALGWGTAIGALAHGNLEGALAAIGGGHGLSALGQALKFRRLKQMEDAVRMAEEAKARQGEIGQMFRMYGQGFGK